MLFARDSGSTIHVAVQAQIKMGMGGEESCPVEALISEKVTFQRQRKLLVAL